MKRTLSLSAAATMLALAHSAHAQSILAIGDPTTRTPYAIEVAVARSNNNVVVVDRSDDGASIRARLGSLSSSGTVTFGAAQILSYDGNTLAVAASNNEVAVVFQLGSYVGPLMLLRGTISGSSITWRGAGQQYDVGANPAIAMWGSRLIEVHQGSYGAGTLWYRTGTVVPNAGVVWDGNAQPYDTGANPAIAMYGANVFEVHQATTGVGALWNRNATIATNGAVHWGSSALYDTGINPTIAANSVGVVEVHQATTNGTLWQHTGAFDANGEFGWESYWHRQLDPTGFGPSLCDRLLVYVTPTFRYLTTRPVQYYTL